MINRFIFVIIMYFSANMAVCQSANIMISDKDLAIAKSALNFSQKAMWDKALSTAKGVADLNNQKIVQKIILWQKYQDNKTKASFAELISYHQQNRDWPLMSVIRLRAESAIMDTTPDKTIITWFTAHPPVTGHGLKHLAVSKRRDHQAAELPIAKETIQLLKQAWIRAALTDKEEVDFHKQYSRILTNQDYLDRINYLLAGGGVTKAKKLLHSVDLTSRNLINARIKLMTTGGYQTNMALKLVPEHLKNDPLLENDLINFHHLNENQSQVKQILLKNTKFPSAISDKLWNIKTRYIREMLENDECKNAYFIAKTHTTSTPQNYVDAEWLAGWIALRFLDHPGDAAAHFINLYNKASTPISKSRGAYWAARAYQQSQMPDKARHWYLHASVYPDSFYGQLALLKLDRNTLAMPADPIMNQKELTSFSNNNQVRAAYILSKLNRQNLASVFVKNAVHQAKSAGEMHLISDFFAKVNNTYLSVIAAKEARQQKGVLIAKHNYPKLKKMPNIAIEQPLAHAIIRQESVFDQHALSSAGAMGLMQLMPSTAKMQAKESSVGYKQQNLHIDPSYNVKIGSAYLNKLITYYDGSYILAIAAYNGGIGNVSKWIKKFGDPRTLTEIDDVVDWLEIIPFKETRNYVQRVMENLQLYRHVDDQHNYKLESMAEDLLR